MSTSPLRIPFSEFQEGRLRRTLQLTPTEAGLDTGFEQARFVGDVEVVLDCHRLMEGEVLVRGSIAYEAEQECVSCLEPIRTKRRAKIDMLFSPESQRPEDPKIAEQLAQGNPDLAYHDGVFLDLEEEIPGIILQELPEYPRCQADCRGLDPHTGLNLNKHQPTVEGKPIDEVLEPEWKRQLRDIRLTG